MEIEDISVREIPEASIDTTIIPTPKAVLPDNIGFPVIQMPGCVRARTLKNKNLVTTDPAGNFMSATETYRPLRAWLSIGTGYLLLGL